MHTLGFLARLVSGELVGDAEQTVRGAASVDEAGPEPITFATDERTLETARRARAGAVVVSKDAPDIGRPVIRVDNPRLAFAVILEQFAPFTEAPRDIDVTARIAADAVIGHGSAVGAYTVIGPGTRIGRNVGIYPGVYVGRDVVIGDDSVLYPGVVVLDYGQLISDGDAEHVRTDPRVIAAYLGVDDEEEVDIPEVRQDLEAVVEKSPSEGDATRGEDR